jgi:acyl-CoA synthetase (AMP-forming)/AMP-acid ligase II
LVDQSNARHVVDVLTRHATNRPHETAFIFVYEDGTRPSLTFAELAGAVGRLARRLREADARGERAVLLYRPGLDFVVAILACFSAGIAAVPVRFVRNERELPHLLGVIRDSGARYVLSTSALQKSLEPVFGLEAKAAVRWIATDEVSTSASDIAELGHDVSPSDIAFLQYTSGSTGHPKGVVVTHANLLHNMRMVRTAFRHDDSTVFAGWLPLHHDMGLMGNVFQPLFLGIKSVLFSPMSFLISPVAWLRAISEWRATTSGAPSFAYEMCVEKIRPEHMQGVDLSSWKIAFNGAEPVKVNVIEAFIEKFGPYGFRPEAFYPCYGMAEATLFVTGGDPSARITSIAVDPDRLAQNVVTDAPTTTRLAGCGTIHEGQVLRIVDPTTLRKLEDDKIGEIWIRGESIAQGYWNRPEETRATFGATTEDGEGPFLRTGDLGFLRRGELFVTGRLKDILIVRGRNYYPDDVETCVYQSHEALRPRGSAAFMVEDSDGERLIVVSEVERSALRKLDGSLVKAVLTRARRDVADCIGLTLSELVLIAPGTLPKTSSGKVRRRHCRELFQQVQLLRVDIDIEAQPDKRATG